MATKFKFTLSNSKKAKFKIRFKKGKHSDKYKFDGKGKVLAHAFYPRSGKIHFDDDETWIKTIPKGRLKSVTSTIIYSY